jgi:hypothetical protein
MFLSGNRNGAGGVEERQEEFPIMMRRTAIALSAVVAVAVTACNSNEAQITTTTIDAALLTTTTTTSPTPPDTDTTDTPDTTEQPSDPVESYEVISRESTDQGETLFILVEPGEYSDVSIENFLGDLLEDETAVAGVEVFDDRAALDVAMKEETERTDEEIELIEQHHLVSLVEGRQVDFQGPMSDYEDFVIGS